MPRSGDRLSPCSCLRPLRMDTLIVVAELLARVGLGQIPVRPRTVLSGGEEPDAGIGQVTQDVLDLLGMEDQMWGGVTPLHGTLHQGRDRRMRSEEHTSELQSLMRISYAVFCL